MLLVDVNVLVYAFRRDTPDHARYATWLDGLVNGEEAFGVADLVLSGFLRVVTHPKIFDPPTPLEAALTFVRKLRDSPCAVGVVPGARHWDLFESLSRRSGAKGNLVADAYLAALAIESGCEWISTDRDFSRFLGLRYRHPFEDEADSTGD